MEQGSEFDAGAVRTADLPDKKQYWAPGLSEYGCVKAMTASGTVSGTESGGHPERFSAGSDRAIKENIVAVGHHPLGVALYLFDYKPEFRDTWGHGRQFGVMADEVETVMPEAVSRHTDGYKQVDYAMLGITRH